MRHFDRPTERQMAALAELREQRDLQVAVPEDPDVVQVNRLIEQLRRAPFKAFAGSTVRFTTKLRNPEGPHQRLTWLVVHPAGGVVERFMGPGAQATAENVAQRFTRQMWERCYRAGITPEQYVDQIQALRDQALLSAPPIPPPTKPERDDPFIGPHGDLGLGLANGGGKR